MRANHLTDSGRLQWEPGAWGGYGAWAWAWADVVSEAESLAMCGAWTGTWTGTGNGSGNGFRSGSGSRAGSWSGVKTWAGGRDGSTMGWETRVGGTPSSPFFGGASSEAPVKVGDVEVGTLCRDGDSRGAPPIRGPSKACTTYNDRASLYCFCGLARQTHKSRYTSNVVWPMQYKKS